MKTMNRAQAVAVVFEFVVNFAIQRAKSTIEDEIRSLPYNQLGWYEMSRVYEKVRDSLRDETSFYCFGISDIDHDRFVAARWALGEHYVNQRIAEILRTFTARTIESLGAFALEERKKEAKKENVDDWVPADY